jgi:hypothetical protein
MGLSTNRFCLNGLAGGHRGGPCTRQSLHTSTLSLGVWLGVGVARVFRAQSASQVSDPSSEKSCKFFVLHHKNVLHHLPRLQNMHEYSVAADANIEAFVQRKYPQLEGPPYVPHVHFFSKNLLGYLETLVAFCPYYRADDGRMAGKMETFYQQAVHSYKDFKDKQLHQYITRKLTAWCHSTAPSRLQRSRRITRILTVKKGIL